jgi:hypothetical protein
MSTLLERIHSEAIDPDAWVCLCGNVPSDDGFYPCNNSGHEVEPTTGWGGLYVCLSCGRIIQQESLEIVGRTSKPRLLED